MPSAYIPHPSKIPNPPKIALAIPPVPEHKVVHNVDDHYKRSQPFALKPVQIRPVQQVQRPIPTAFIEKNLNVIMQIRNALNGVVEVDLLEENDKLNESQQTGRFICINANANGSDSQGEDYSDSDSSEYDPDRF